MNFEIVKNYGELSKTKSGWAVEFTLVKWLPEKGEPFLRYDIRHWDPEHTQPGKGITLSEEEVKRLKECLAEV